MNFRGVCGALLFVLIGCALPPSDTTRQTLVPERDVQAVRYTREGINFMRSGRYLDAEMSFLRALTIEPNAERIVTNRGVALFMQERYDEALEIFQALEKRDDGSLGYKLWIGRTLVELGRYKDGVTKLQDALAEAVKKEDLSSSASFSRTLSVIYFEAGDESRAICASSDAFNFTPNAVEAVRHARLLSAIGYSQNGAAFLQNFFGATTLPSADAHLIYAQAALVAESYEGAADFLQDAVLMDPQEPDTQYLMKLLVLVMGTDLQERGIATELAVLDEDTKRNLLLDPRLESSELLYLPAKILRKINDMKARVEAKPSTQELISSRLRRLLRSLYLIPG